MAAGASQAEGICPVLFHFAGEDSNPGPDDMATLAEALQQQAIEHEFHVYDGVNHGFSCVDSSAFDREASDASWQRTSEPSALHSTWPPDPANCKLTCLCSRVAGSPHAACTLRWRGAERRGGPARGLGGGCGGGGG